MRKNSRILDERRVTAVAAKKRVLSVFMVLTMLFSLMPFRAFAGEDDGDEAVEDEYPVTQDTQEDSHHDHFHADDDEGYVIDATCTDGGCTIYTCSDPECLEEYESDFTDPLGHLWDEGEVVDPTCTDRGYTLYTCTRPGCGVTYTDCYTDPDPENHSWDEGTLLEATCTEPDRILYTCSSCYAEITVPVEGSQALGHDEIIVEEEAATCEEAGHTAGTFCSRCDAVLSETETIPALGHDWVAGDPVAPTCTEEGYTPYTCSRCEETKNDDFKDALGHDWVAGEPVAPTCTGEGYTPYTCSRCEETKNDDPKDALGHKPEAVEEVPATATEPGRTAGTICSVCKEVLSGCEPIEPLGEEAEPEKIEITIDTSPQNAEVRDGVAEFSVSALVQPEGTVLSWQWQRLDTTQEYKDREAAWEDIAGETESVLRLSLADLDASKDAARYSYRCRISAGEGENAVSALTDEAGLTADVRSYDSDVITGFAKRDFDPITEENKPALIVLNRSFPETIDVLFGGTVRTELDPKAEAGTELPQTLEGAKPSDPGEVFWVCEQDYDDDIEEFSFVLRLDGTEPDEYGDDGFAFDDFKKDDSSPDLPPPDGYRLNGFELAPGLERQLPKISVQVGPVAVGTADDHCWSGFDVDEIDCIGSDDGGGMRKGTSGTSFLPFTEDENHNIIENPLPPVRDQGIWGTCWAFGAIGAIETDMIFDGMTDNGIDLSEYYLAYYSANKYTGNRTSGTNDKVLYYGGGHYLNNGGTNVMSYRLMANGIGPVYESVAPYNSKGTPSYTPTGNETPAVQLTGAYLINPYDRGTIKAAIRQHGGVDAAMWAEGASANNYYSSTYNSYYCGTASYANHEIMLVGWDDTFPAAHFNKDNKPEENGAWLARNSWGLDDYGYSGYFWISYYDSGLLSDIVTAYDVESPFYSYCYSYDSDVYPNGRLSLADGESVSETFQIKGSEIIRAVGFETLTPFVTATITVSTGSTSSVAQSWTRSAGFYMAVLDKPLAVAAGSKVTVSLSFEGGGVLAVEGSPEYGTAIAGSILFSPSCDSGGYTVKSGGRTRTEPYDARLKLYTGPGSGTAATVTGIILSGNAEDGFQTQYKDETQAEITGYSLDLGYQEYSRLTAKVYSAQEEIGTDITWVSSDPYIVTVDNGLVFGLSPGTATVTAKSHDGSISSAPCTITVGGTNVESVTLSSALAADQNGKYILVDDARLASAGADQHSDFDITTGYRISYSCKVLPNNASNKTVFWSSSNPAVATVNENDGYCNVLSNGTAVITVTAQDGAHTANKKSDSYEIRVRLSTYTITYDLKGGAGSLPNQSKTRYIPIQLSSTKPTRTGYTFQGWSSGSGKQYSSGSKFNENGSKNGDRITLSAVWKPNTYAVTYNANGGSGAPGNQTKTHGTDLTLSSAKPTRAGYTFLGWATSASASSAQYQPGAKYTANAPLTLYAVWKINSYTISYDANGGSGAPGKQTKTYGQTLTLSTIRPTRSGYNFDGWATSKTGTTAQYQPGGQYTANATMTLYAVWRAVVTINPTPAPAPASGSNSDISLSDSDSDISLGASGSPRTASVDGVTCTVNADGTLVLPKNNSSAKVIETYEFTGSGDVHTQYPSDLKVWIIKDADGRKTAERVESLDNIMQYSGYSIRITGKKGIRMITSVPTELKNALTSGGLAGYTLEEYGTIVAWADELNGSDLTWDNKRFSNYAYKRDEADPVFNTVDGLTQYTNVLVGFTDDQVPRDLVMRSYMILSADGDTIIIYGGPVQRSIGYVAYRNRDAFQPGTDPYHYVWDLIHITYGDAYDAEYKG